MHCLLPLFVLSCYVVVSSGRGFHHKETSKPQWPKRYYVEGFLSLPYAELNEPFTAWFDGVSRRSRIDYYGGLSKTIQRGDMSTSGVHFMVGPMSNEIVRNQINCFQLNGTADSPVGPQAILPDVSNFTYTGVKQYNGDDVDIWQYKYDHTGKYNVYTLYVRSGSFIPVFYEMVGYDSLLGSHFDDYRLTYNVYAENFPDSVFDEPVAGMECHGFPGPGYQSKIIANPMQEFIHPENADHLHPMYNEFTKTFSKESTSDSRMHTFKHNVRYINSINRKNLSFRLKINHLADHSPSELRKLRGRQTSVGVNGKQNHGKPFKPTISVNVPKEINWRLRGAVTPVKDQAVCGSCWSFGAAGTIEGTLFLKTGRLVRLSQQNLMDCSWGYGNNGCDGGEEFRSYEYIMKHGGITTEMSYGPYLAVDGLCHPEDAVIGANITGYVNVTSGDLDALKIAIAQYGPIAVGIDAAHLSLVFYSHGVYYEPECGNTPDRLDHAVLAVGYGVLDSEPYWLIKNSWSTHWGNDGYVLMSQKNNNCGVATDATFVEM